MTEPDCTIETTQGEIDAYLEGLIEGNGFGNNLEQLIELSQKLKRDMTCHITVKYTEPEQPSEDN